MSDLSISTVVDVNISVSAAYSSSAGFGTLLIVTAETGVIDATERIRAYSDIDGVSEDWGASTEVVAAATSYFSQEPKPSSLMVGFRNTGETCTEALSAIQEVNDDWYGVMFTKEVRDHVVIETEDAVDAIASWVEARTKVYFMVSNDVLCKTPSDTTNIGYLLTAKGLKRTLGVYSSTVDEYADASVAARAFTVQFTAGSPTITLKFKTLPGITVEAVSTNQKSALDSFNMNTYISVAGNKMFAEGVTMSGVFFDEVHGVDWLEATIQDYVFEYMYTRTAKVPYTDLGIQSLAQKVRSALTAGVTAGLLAPGTADDGTYLAEGFVVETVAEADVSSIDKGNRVYNGISFTALGAGAIHGVTINGVFER